MKYILRNIFFTVLIIICSCTDKKTGDQQVSLMDASRQELATALSERDQLLSLVAEITSGIEQIKRLEKVLTLASTTRPENNTQRMRILSDMESIKHTLQERRERLAELESRLQQSALFNQDLQNVIDAVNHQLALQTAEIDSLRLQLSMASITIGALNEAVDSLNYTMASVNMERDEAVAESVQLALELNTCYYVMATMADLKKHKVIESGFLRRSRFLKGDFDKGFFEIGDKRLMDSLIINSSKARLHTIHPDGSYEIEDCNGRKVLKIIDAKRFWSLSNYMVIQTD